MKTQIQINDTTKSNAGAVYQPPHCDNLSSTTTCDPKSVEPAPSARCQVLHATIEPEPEWIEAIYDARVCGVRPSVRLIDREIILFNLGITFYVYAPNGNIVATINKSLDLDRSCDDCVERLASIFLDRKHQSHGTFDISNCMEMLGKECKVVIGSEMPLSWNGKRKRVIQEILPSDVGEWLEVDDGCFMYLNRTTATPVEH